ncbi:nuclease [Phenylobacterium sp.]|uniref:nuclease n=1 Tax=Phenylobacterium sp. TaxID=1871053 RepID=UPI0025F02ED8|nr:nuclease [Phenylobacterium sp.]
MLRAFTTATLLALALGGTARAATCGGEPPADAAEFRGPVLEVLDGESLCVALGADPSSWVPVRLADAPMKVSTAPASRGALMAASFGQDVTCRVTGRDQAGLVAQCVGDRGSVGRLSQAADVVKAGLAWR